jgi:hypothetical protein
MVFQGRAMGATLARAVAPLAILVVSVETLLEWRGLGETAERLSGFQQGLANDATRQREMLATTWRDWYESRMPKMLSVPIARRWAGLLVSALYLSSAQPAGAQSSSAAARVLFREARALMDKGRFAQACPKLEESLRLDDGMGTQFNLAHCWEQIGRTASAWGMFLDVAAAASAAQQRKREVAARARADALEPNLTRILIQVTEPVPEGLVVKRSGEEVGHGSWGAAVPVDPGPIRVEASAPGRLPWATEVAANGKAETVTVNVPLLEEEKVEVPAEVPLVAEEAAPVRTDPGPGISNGRIVTSTVFAALGVGGVITGTVFGLKANSETAAARELCVGGESGSVCSRDESLAGFDGGAAEKRELDEHRKSADRAALIGYIGWGVGAAGLIGSAVVLLTAPSRGEPHAESAALRLDPLFAPGFVGTGLRGEF